MSHAALVTPGAVPDISVRIRKLAKAGYLLDPIGKYNDDHSEVLHWERLISYRLIYLHFCTLTASGCGDVILHREHITAGCLSNQPAVAVTVAVTKAHRPWLEPHRGRHCGS